MFVVKPVGNRTSFFWQSQKVFALLYHHQTRELLLSLHWSLTQWCDSSAERQLCSSTEGKPQLPPWNYTASKKHAISSVQHNVMRLAAPLASEQLKCTYNGRDLLAFTIARLAVAFRALLNLLFVAGSRGRKSQRNLSHHNLKFLLVREEGINFLPLPPSHLEGTRGVELSKKQRGKLLKARTGNAWENNDEEHKPDCGATCGAEEFRSVETLRPVMAERAGVDTAACYI